MEQDDIRQEYFDWIYNAVCGYNKYSRLSYRKLLNLLHNIEYTWALKMDSNRAYDGIELRYRFGYENGYKSDFIDKYLDDGPCSVLEMMVALSFRVEEQIMDDSKYGNRTGQWFWNMIVSLGLGGMSNSHFNEKQACHIVYSFLDRNYEPNGKGGLFTLENCTYDLRDVEIWTQCMWYLNEIIEI